MGSRQIARMLVIAIVAMASACAPMQTRTLLEQRDTLEVRRSVLIENVPFIAQQDKYCGPATLAMALGKLGHKVTQQKVASTIYTPGRAGTLRSDMLAGARRYGTLAVRVEDLRSLIEEINAGNPVIVFQNLSLDLAPQWHYALAIGYDLDKEVIILNSADRNHLETNMATFERTWKRGNFWAIVLTPPDKLPAGRNLENITEGAVGLERAGQLDAAVKAYRSILTHWPDSYTAAMGLGNVYYKKKQYHQAQKAFRKATTIKLKAPEAWNNLAYAYLETGAVKKALAAANRAVEHAPTENSRYHETQKEIRQAAGG